MKTVARSSPVERVAHPWVVFLCVAMTAVAVHAWSITQPFLAEDFGCLTEIHRKLETSAWSPLFAFFAPGESDQMPFFRPMVELAMAIDYSIWGTDPSGFHVTNLVLFGGVCGLTALLAARLARSSYVGMIAGLLLTVSPLVPEDVTWVLGRDGLIPMLFVLVACHAVLATSPRRARLGVAGFFLAGILAKEWVAAMIPVLVALRALALRDTNATPWRTALRDTSLIWPVFLVYLALRVTVLGKLVGGYETGSPSVLAGQFWIDRSDYLLALLVQAPERTISGVSRYVAGALVVGGLLCGVRAARHRLGSAASGAATVCVLWILSCLVVHFPVRVDPKSLADSRYLFPSLPALCVLVAIACRGADARGPTRSALLAGVVTVVMGAGLIQSAAEWSRAGEAMNALMASVRQLTDEAQSDRVEIHGLPPTMGRARFGMGLTALDPPFREARTPVIRFVSRLYTPHAGLNRASSYLSLVGSVRNPQADTELFSWNCQALRIQPVGESDTAVEVRGHVVRESGRFELQCTKLQLEFRGDTRPPASADHVVLRGAIAAENGTTRLLVQEVENALPLVEVQPLPDDPDSLWLIIRHRPNS